ncbi:MAG: DUF2007 domain-containing protein [Pseudoxanthomonas sp.]
MRQVFTSLRIETVEGVATLLREAGIEVYLANGRSYHSKRGGQFSYAEPMKLKQQPSIWVTRAEDQPRAREILRQAGLLPSTRPGQGDPLVFAGGILPEEPGKRSLAWRIRVGLLVVIAITVLITVTRNRGAPQAPPAQTPIPAAEQPPAQEDEAIRVRITPPAADPPPKP